MGILSQKLLNEQIQQSSRKTLINKGNYGLSYQEIFNKISQILTYDKIMSAVNNRAAKLLYISYGIKVIDARFGVMSIGGIEAYVVDQAMSDKYDHYSFDIAMIDNQPIIFLFRNCMVNEDIPKSIRITNIYTVFDALVAIMNDTGLLCATHSINSIIASYAPYVLTVKLLLHMGIEFDIDDILYAAPESDRFFINYTTFDLVNKIDINDLLMFGALCEYID